MVLRGIKKKKLLVFHPALAPYRVDLFNSLHDLYETEFFFLNENVLSQNFSQKKLIKATRININYLNKGFSLFGRFFRFGLNRVINKEKPELILSTEYSTITLSLYFLVVLFHKNIKLYTLTEDNISMMKNASSIQIAIRKFFLKRLDGVIVTHNGIATYFIDHFNAKTKFIIFPTIRTETLFRKQLQESISIANENIHEYKLNGKQLLLYVGRLVQVKNLERLIKAFGMVKKEISESALVFVGDGESLPKLKQLVYDIGIADSVIFTGRLEGSELLSWYNTSNIFILPSKFEPFGAVVNEALLAGCYSLLSKNAGSVCLVEENVNGNIFNPFKVEEIAKSIKTGMNKVSAVSPIDSVKASKMLIRYDTTINNVFDELQ